MRSDGRVLATLALMGALLFCGFLVGHAGPVHEPAAPAEKVALPALPLRTSGRWIVDARGQRFKLAGVNWYGAEELDFVVAGLEYEPLPVIARRIRQLGFNVVRLPWSNEMAETDPVIAPARLAANPALTGKRALSVLDAVVDALGAEGLLVVLVNHVSRADWCCSDNDGNGLWYTWRYPESSWIADWKRMAERYRDRPHVIGADLRNEPRTVASWGGLFLTDWRAAAQRGGEAVLATAPSWLIFVEGIRYATDLRGAYQRPLSFPGRLVWSVHDYSWFHSGVTSYEALHEALGKQWGFLLTQGQPYTAPVWVGEFGTAHTPEGTGSDTDANGRWFGWFARYLREADIDWAYWALNGTQARGTGRVLGAEEDFGILDPRWRGPALDEHTGRLQDLQEATQGPGISEARATGGTRAP